MAFCRFYGYDLPTEAEWEKAARGPDYDDQDEHLVYPWGNTCADSQAWKTYASSYNYGIYTSSSKSSLALTSVSAYDAYVGGYGLCDVVGNAAEWTRSSGEEKIGTYPTEETLTGDRQLPFVTVDRIVKGRGADGLYARTAVDPAQWYLSEFNYSSRYHLIGFRAVRRESSVKDVEITREVYEDFETFCWPLQVPYDFITGYLWENNGRTWVFHFNSSGGGGGYVTSSPSLIPPDGIGYNNSKGLFDFHWMKLPSTVGRLMFVRLKVRSAYDYTNNLYCQSDIGAGEYVKLPKYMSSFMAIDIPVIINSENYKLYPGSQTYFDEIELWTVPKN